MTWPDVALSDLLQLSIGGVWGKESGAEDTEVRVWRVTELKAHGRLDPSSAARRSVPRPHYESRSLQPGDLLLEKSGGGPKTPVGRVGLVRSVPEPAVCANFMQLMRPRTELVEPRFLHLYLNHFHQTGGTAGMQTATTNIRNIKASEYVRLRVPLPTRTEQRRIVDLLEDHLSRLNAAGSYIEANVRRARNWHSGLVSRVLWSADYPTAEVGTLLREPMRNGRSDRAAQGSEAGTRTLTLTAVTKNAFTDENTKLTVTPADRADALWLEPGDVFVQRSNTPALVGTTALYDGPREWAIFPDLLIRLRADDRRIDSRFLTAALRSEEGHNQLRRKAKGLAGSMPKIDQATIATAVIPVPEPAEQARVLLQVEQATAALDNLRSELERARRRSAALRRSLLAAAFSGRLTGAAPYASSTEMTEMLAGV